MGEYTDVLKMLESIKSYELREGEALVPLCSSKGSEVGFATADSDFPSIRWSITLRNLKSSCQQLDPDNNHRLFETLRPYQERREYLARLRSGLISIPEPPLVFLGPLRPPTPTPLSAVPHSTDEDDLEDELQAILDMIS